MVIKVEHKLKKVGEMSFWIAFVIELLIVIVDKSAYINPYESMLFRLTFVLFGIKIVTTKYSKKEWLCIIVFGALAVLSYLINERDETVRAVVFVASCKDIDLKKMLKTTLFVTAVGSAVLFLLSITGIFGAVSMTADFGRGPTPEGSIETRYCFGMGHPNAFQGMLFMISTLALYLYADNMKLLHFICLGAVNIVAYLFTDSNTSLLVMILTIAGVVVMRYCKGLREGKTAYILGALLFIAIVMFSVYGAKVGRDTPFMFRLDKILNGRFQYAHLVEAAQLENWKLFGDAANMEYFDQGFIRLFYWYGIVIGILYVAANLYLIWCAYQKKDYALLVIVVAYAIFSIMEAHLISVYLLRNYLLIWMGYYWYHHYMGETYENCTKDRRQAQL